MFAFKDLMVCFLSLMYFNLLLIDFKAILWDV